MRIISGTVNFPEEILFSLKESKDGFMRLLQLYAAMKLYEEGKLSLGKAASLAGYNRLTFIDILSQHHVSVLRHTEETLDSEIQAAQDLARQPEQ